jgi:hypothetical protein
MLAFGQQCTPQEVIRDEFDQQMRAAEVAYEQDSSLDLDSLLASSAEFE